MAEDQGHQALLRFIRKAVDVPGAHTKDDLYAFRDAAMRAYPALVPVIDAYIRLADQSDTEVSPRPSRARQPASREVHLFDLLRERTLFPSNSDLSAFAARVLPNISDRRFNKMSRADIAARIIEHLEARDPRTRQELERSMRDALAARPSSHTDRESFLTKWERIIKGIEL
jgi:hypothetical protein